MEELVRMLHENNASLAVKTESGEVRLFYGRGVSDLYRLYTNEPQTLKGATVADKVVGKGAAAMMILSKVKSAHSDVVSQAAMELFKMHSFDISCDSLVPYIINRKKDGQCPLEKRCGTETELERLFEVITDFVNQGTGDRGQGTGSINN